MCPTSWLLSSASRSPFRADADTAARAPPSFDQETEMAFGIATYVKIEYTSKIDVWRRVSGATRGKYTSLVPQKSYLNK